MAKKRTRIALVRGVGNAGRRLGNTGYRLVSGVGKTGKNVVGLALETGEGVIGAVGNIGKGVINTFGEVGQVVGMRRTRGRRTRGRRRGTRMVRKRRGGGELNWAELEEANYQPK
jgi:hypothetical protein